MQWNIESKKAFVQALNIEFLTMTGSYTNFQLTEVKGSLNTGQIYMLFRSGTQEECQKYLEQVTARYKGAITSFKNSNFDPNSFPFCINLSRFSYENREKIKFEIPLNERVVNNLYHIFVGQLLSFSMDMASLPNDLELNDYDRNDQGYITGWAFSQVPGNPDLKKEKEIKKLFKKYNFPMEKDKGIVHSSDGIKYNYIFIHKDGVNEAVQTAIQDFPKKLLSRYPKSLLMLFYIFCSNLESQKVSDKCTKFVKRWDRAGTVEIDKNTVRFSRNKDLVDKEMKMKRSVAAAIKEINSLYEVRNFISFNQGNNGNLERVFTFDLSNIDAFIRNIPCDIDCVKKAQELAYKQLNGTVTPGCNASPSSSKRSSLPAPSKSSDVAGSTSLKCDSSVKSDKSNDSALGASASSTGYSDSELRRNSKSFDSGNHSRPSSSDMAGSKNLEQGLNKVASNGGINFRRNLIHSKSFPSPGATLSKMKVEKGKSLGDRKSNSLLDVR